MSRAKITSLSATIAAAALAASPATAQIFGGNDYDSDDGIGTEEVIAGAVILGGLAAILGGDDDDDRYDRRYDDYYYDDRYDGAYYRNNREGYSRELIERCVYAAENDARRYGQANVTQIEDVDRDGYYVRVEGDIQIARNYARDRYGRAVYDRDVDEGEFSCTIDRRGRVTNIDYDDIDWRR